MGFGGSSKQSSSSGTTLSPYAGGLNAFGQQLQQIALPILQLFGKQTTEALKTGGSNAQLPIVQRSTDAARRALSGSVDSLRQSLGRAGLGNTGFAKSLIAQQEQTGAEDIAKIGPDMAWQLMSGAPGFGAATAAGGSGAVSSAMTGNRTTYGAGTTTAQPGFWDTFLQSLQAAGNIASAVTP